MSLTPKLTVLTTSSLHQGAAPCPGLTCARGILSETLRGCARGCRLQGAQVYVRALRAGQQGRPGQCQWQGAQPAGTGRAMGIHCVWKWPEAWQDLEGRGKGLGGQGLGVPPLVWFPKREEKLRPTPNLHPPPPCLSLKWLPLPSSAFPRDSHVHPQGYPPPAPEPLTQPCSSSSPSFLTTLRLST